MKLHRLVVRAPKSEAAFIHFVLEANEGLCFYSTLKRGTPGPYRDIELFCSDNLENQLNNLIRQLRRDSRLEILERQTVDDQTFQCATK